MSGSGAWDGYGSPPWDPADPVPDLDETRAIPGLGSVPGPADAPGYGPGYNGGQHYNGRQPYGNGGPYPGGQSYVNGNGNGQQYPGGQSYGNGNGNGRPYPGGQSYGNGNGNGNGQQYPGGQSYVNGNGNGNGQQYPGGQSYGNGQPWPMPGSPHDQQQAGPDDSRSGQPQGGNRGRGAGNGGTTAAHAKRGPGGPGGTRPPRRRRSFWRELPVLIVVALVLAVVIKTFAIQAFYIPSASMEKTLAIGDRVLINKVVYHVRSIHRGDIIVFDGSGSWDFNNPPANSNIFSKVVDDLEGVVGITHDSSIYIKRVVGLPGDHVACCNSKGQVTVNGVVLSEGGYLYPGNSPSTQSFHITVPAGRLWVMGDHRAVSYDSRGHMGDPGGGTIPQSAVLGRAFVIIWPPSKWGFLNIPGTFEQPRLNASAAAGSAAAAGGSSAALLAAMDNGTPVQPASSALPLALGFAGAVPLTWLQRTIRLRRKTRRSRPSS